MSGIIAQNTLDNSGLIKSPAGGGAWNFIKKLTASGSGDLSFVDGTSDVVLDSTYREYLFTFTNIHPSATDGKFQFNLSADSGSNYNVTKTTTIFRLIQYENDGGSGIEYYTAGDLAQGTGFQILTHGYLGNDNDQSMSGSLHCFGLSDTTFVKHFMAETNYSNPDDSCSSAFVAGYGNTTSACDAVQFSMSSGNIDTGDICLYGITT